VTRARVEKIPADVATARALADQARSHLASARASGVDAESAYGLAYQAALKALIAALLAAGLRVTAGAGGHVVIITEAKPLVDVPGETFDRLDRMRRTRHQLFYELDEVTASELDAGLAHADAIVAAATRFVSGHR
jgi:HEPN domain